MQHHGALEAVIGKESASAISQVIVSAAEGIAIDVASEILHRFGNGVIHSEVCPEALIFFISRCGITYHHIGAFGEVAAHIHKPVGPCRTAVGVGHHYQFVAGGFDAKHYGKFAARHIATAVGDKCLAQVAIFYKKIRDYLSSVVYRTVIHHYNLIFRIILIEQIRQESLQLCTLIVAIHYHSGGSKRVGSFCALACCRCSLYGIMAASCPHYHHHTQKQCRPKQDTYL